MADASRRAIFLTDRSLRDRYGITGMTLYRWRKHRGFPKPIQPGGRNNLTPAAEVLAWEGQQLAAREEQAPERPELAAE